MEFETVVLERDVDVNLGGEAQGAYEAYPQLRQNLAMKRDQYIALVDNLNMTSGVSAAQMKKIDALADEIEADSAKLAEVKETLRRKLEGLLLDVKSGEAEIATLVGADGDGGGVEACREMIAEAILRRDEGDLVAAIKVAVRASQGMAGLMETAKSLWKDKAVARATAWRLLSAE